jgi:hypothetical protein
MANKQRLGEILVQKGLVEEKDIKQALRTQVGGSRRLGHILVRMKLITADQLAETLSSQLGIEICDITKSFSSKVSGVLPSYLCRKYDVLPLAFQDNNILEVAMADPSDEEAIQNLEDFTGKVILPQLAKHSDIERELPVRVPLSLKEFLSPQFTTSLTRFGVGICMAMLVVLAGVTYKYIHQTTYGIEEMVDGSKVYRNHDLILEVNRDGGLNFSGRSAFAKGYYSVAFNSKQELIGFLDRRKADFSEKQSSWLGWAVEKRLP